MPYTENNSTEHTAPAPNHKGNIMDNITKAFYLIVGLTLLVVLLIANPLGLLGIIGAAIALGAVLIVIEYLVIRLSDQKEDRAKS